jgi:hypothetical protein
MNATFSRWMFLPVFVLSWCAAAHTLFAQNAGTTLVPKGAVWKYVADGSNQGTAWKQPAFDHSAWNIGPAQLGYGEGDEATMLPVFDANGNKYITAYFRTWFGVTNRAALTNLTLNLLRDDGAVVYINGIEVVRDNMPAGTIAYNTVASVNMGGTDETNFFAHPIDPSVLVAGANSIEVEVHQASLTSNDISFDLQLIAQIISNAPPTGPVIVQQPQSQTVSAGANVTFAVSATGTAPLSYRWRRDGATITNSTTASLTLVNVQTNQAGAYSVVVSNSVGVAESANAVLTVLGPTNPPPTSLTLVATGSVWRYLDNRTDPGTAWRAIAYDDSAWPSGRAKLGFGEGDESTVINPGFDQNQPLSAAYFRHSFNVSNASTVSNLVVRARRDDGIIVYLNGVEVFRNNMPAGPVSYSTLASATAVDDGREFQTGPVPSGLLVNGVNIVAAEVHQASVNSGDLSFDLALAGDVIAPPPPEQPIVNVTATDAEAAETGLLTIVNPGVFTFTRSGNLDTSWPVYFTLSGTANNGVDYIRLTNQVMFPAGSAETRLTVTPLNDAFIEGTETVVVTLLDLACATTFPPPPGCYAVGFSNRATVYISDVPPPTNVPPTVSIVMPGNGASFTAPANITIVANADDSDGSVTYVEFFNGTNSLGIRTNFATLNPLGPFVLTWTNVAAGNYTLRAQAFDNGGAGTVSAAAQITVTNQSVRPLVTIRATQSETAEVDPSLDIVEQPGVFTVSRSSDGSFNQPLTVRYTIAGSAVNGVDY